jgi:hypothetical protein
LLFSGTALLATRLQTLGLPQVSGKVRNGKQARRFVVTISSLLKNIFTRIKGKFAEREQGWERAEFISTAFFSEADLTFRLYKIVWRSKGGVCCVFVCLTLTLI